MGERLWLYVGAVRAFDGWMGMLRMEFPDDYLLVSFLSTLPMAVLRRATQALNAFVYDTSPGTLLVKAWPWGDTARADAAFQRGAADAAAALGRLRPRLLAWLGHGESVSGVR